MARYTPEMRERALRMLAEVRPEHPNTASAIRHVSGLLGINAETLRVWHRRFDVDTGTAPGVTTDAAQEIKRLKKKVAELEKANEILRSASVFFATELGRPSSR